MVLSKSQIKTPITENSSNIKYSTTLIQGEIIEVNINLNILFRDIINFSQDIIMDLECIEITEENIGIFNVHVISKVQLEINDKK